MKQSLILIALIVMLTSCESETDATAPSIDRSSVSWSCDAEKTTRQGEALVFTDGDATFAVGESQSNKAARSGTNSVKLDKSLPYGMTFRMSNVEVGDAVEISAWRKISDSNLGCLIIDSDDGKFYQQAKSKVNRDGDWEQIKGLIYVEEAVLDNNLKCFLFNNDAQPAYFDDFEVTHHKNYDYPVAEDISSLELTLGPDKIRKLKNKRTEALEAGVLLSDDNDWVPATVTIDGVSYKADVRLKGDWLDHLKGIKWSYRVKVRGGSFMGMKSFSLHTPAARDYLNEWMLHKMFEQEDVLTTRYGFVNLSVNGDTRGVYAYEEHFDKQLVESKKRREGPLLKFDESAAFQLTAEGWANDKTYSRALLTEMAEIMPFKAGRTRQSPVLKELYIQGQKLLYQHQHNLAPASEIYNIEKLATMYALCDIAGAHHGLAWHNQRFYMNPVTCQIEPVAYDCFTNWELRQRDALSGLTGMEDSSGKLEYFRQLPFNDPAFRMIYLKKLKELSQPDYIQTFFKTHKEEMESLEGALNEEIEGYQLNRKYWIESAKYVAGEAIKFEAEMQNAPSEFTPGRTLDAGNGKFAWNPVGAQSLKAYLADSSNGTFNLEVVNSSMLDLELMGFGTKVSLTFPLKKPAKLEPHHLNLKKYKYNSKGQFMYFRVKGRDEVIMKEITWFPFPKGKTTRQLMKHSIPPQFTQAGNVIKISGTKTISSNVFIPAGHEVQFDAGSKITFNNCSFISESPVQINGTAEAPVIFNSNNAQGFTVLCADGRSSLTHTTFDGFNTQLIPGWTLTGAVNFYESDVDLVNCIFENNICEDALNIIRSDFSLRDSKILNAFADGFDADYCTGEVKNCQFKDNQNDCIDFSTSVINITDCVIDGAGDKGVSGGENSQLSLSNMSISNSNIGVASKDMSQLTIQNSTITSCRYGYTIFQKKSEFGPASIIADNVELTKIDTLELIEIGSFLEIDGNRTEGNITIDLVKLYDL